MVESTRPDGSVTYFNFNTPDEADTFITRSGTPGVKFKVSQSYKASVTETK